MKRRKKAAKDKITKAEKAFLKLMMPTLMEVFFSGDDVVEWPDMPRRKRRGSGDGMPAR